MGRFRNIIRRASNVSFQLLINSVIFIELVTHVILLYKYGTSIVLN